MKLTDYSESEVTSETYFLNFNVDDTLPEINAVNFKMVCNTPI